MPYIEQINDVEEQTTSTKSFNWQSWAKAGLVFAGTIGTYLTMRTTGSFSLVGAWLEKAKQFSQKPSGRQLFGLSSSMSSGFDEPPVLINNQLTISPGEKKLITASELLATDLDSDNSTLIFSIQNPQYGSFELANTTIITDFSQQQITDSEIYFRHDGNTEPPVYQVSVSDNSTITFPQYPVISFVVGHKAVTDEFQVNTYTIGEQLSPASTGLSNNKFVVVWHSDQDNGSWGIYGQLFNNDGTKSGEEFQVNTHTITTQQYPAVTKLTNDTFVVMWQSDGQGNYYNVYGQIFDNYATKIGGEFQVNTYLTDAQTNPSVVSFNDGKFVAIWMSSGQDGSNYGIYGQIFKNDGSKSGSEFQVNTHTMNDQKYPTIASFPDNHFVVVWQSDGQDNSDWGIYGQLFSNNGNKDGLEFQANTYTTGTQWYAKVASLSNDKFVVIWISDGQDGDSYGIYAQLYNVNGTNYGSEFRVNTYTKNAQVFFSISTPLTKLDNEKFVVTWHSAQEGSNNVYAQLFDFDGKKYSGEFRINIFTVGNQVWPSISTLNNGEFVITWLSSDQDNHGVYARIFAIEPNLPIINNNLFYICENATVPIFATNLNATDIEDTPELLTYHISHITGGKFTLVNSTDAITTFTQKQINQSEIQFAHNGDEEPAFWYITVKDSALNAYAIPANITYIPINDIPIILENRLILKDNDTVILDELCLNVTDVDEHQEFKYFVDDVQYGHFELSSQPEISISNFTQGQLETGIVQFVHDGTNEKPSYTMQVSDGYDMSANSTVDVSFNYRPEIINNHLVIGRGESVFFTSDYLSAIDCEGDDTALTFIVSDIQNGNFKKVGIPTSILSFLQQEITSGNIYFTHDWRSENPPSYSIKVSDGILESALMPANITFTYTLSDSSWQPPESSVSSSEIISSSSSTATQNISEASSVISDSSVASKLSSSPSSSATSSSGILSESDRSISQITSSSSTELPTESSLSSEPKQDTIYAIIIGIIGGLVLICGVSAGLGYLWYRKHNQTEEDDFMLDTIGEEDKSVPRIPQREMKFGRQVGKGACGTVYRGIWKGAEVAIKALPAFMMEGDPKTIKEFEQEAVFMSQLRHPNIVHFYGICRDPDNYCIVMEYMGGGTLDKLLYDQTKELPWNPIRWKIVGDITNGLWYLHDQNILHRDLKSPNILLDEHLRAKLTDFGIAKATEETTRTMTKGVGTVCWMAPEVMIEETNIIKTYTNKADVYSYGIILWEIAAREFPYKDWNQFQIPVRVSRGERLDIPIESPTAYADLIRRCWSQRADLRPTMQDVKNELDRVVRVDSEELYDPQLRF